MPENAAAAADDPLTARRVALEILVAVLDRRQAFDQALDDHPEYRTLPPRDRAFIRMMTATTLRRLGQIDDFITRAGERPEPPRPLLLHNLLRLGMTQLAFMASPDYAVVDTAVRLAEAMGLERQKGFVNAVLRRAARDWRGWLEKQDPSQLNIPAWLLQHWIADYGLRTAAEIAQASLAEAPLDITVKDPATRGHWAENLPASPLPTGSLRRLESGGVRDLPGFSEGAWWVQDAAAALPATLFGAIEGRTVIDLCAAPGGKTAQLAAAGAHVVALDRSAQRLMRLEENMRRLQLSDRVVMVAADAAVWRPTAPADFILLDAPCTATGTIRRHPDVMHLKTPQDQERMAALQSRLLDSAAAMLAPGGTLIYCTCSLQKAEGEAQIDALLQRNPALSRRPITAAECGGLADIISPAGDIRTLPFHLATLGGMDGFYAARLVKT